MNKKFVTPTGRSLGPGASHILNWGIRGHGNRPLHNDVACHPPRARPRKLNSAMIRPHVVLMGLGLERLRKHYSSPDGCYIVQGPLGGTLFRTDNAAAALAAGTLTNGGAVWSPRKTI